MEDSFQKDQSNLDMFFQMFDDEGACCAHEVLRMETLDDDLVRMCKPLEIEPVKSNNDGKCRKIVIFTVFDVKNRFRSRILYENTLCKK